MPNSLEPEPKMNRLSTKEKQPISGIATTEADSLREARRVRADAVIEAAKETTPKA